MAILKSTEGMTGDILSLDSFPSEPVQGAFSWSGFANQEVSDEAIQLLNNLFHQCHWVCPFWLRYKCQHVPPYCIRGDYKHVNTQ